MDVFCAPIETIDEIWKKVSPYFQRALDKYNLEYSLQDLNGLVKTGQWKLFVAVNDDLKIVGGAIVSFIMYPKSYVAFVTCIGGKHFTNEQYFIKFIELLKQYGADRIQGYVTESIERLYRKVGIFRKTAMVEITI